MLKGYSRARLNQVDGVVHQEEEFDLLLLVGHLSFRHCPQKLVHLAALLWTLMVVAGPEIPRVGGG